MIMQAYQTFEQYNQSGMSGLVSYPNAVLPIFTPMFLFSIYVIIVMASYFSAKRTTGRGDFIGSMAAAGFVTTVIAIMMTFITGMINTLTLTTTFIIGIVGVVLLLMRDR